MRTFAIGDIHGCKTALETLLDCLELQPGDRLIFLGDYIDRGPDSCGVLEKLIELSGNSRHVFLRGNHDDWLLTARTEPKMFRSWLSVGGKQTLESYGAMKWEDLPPSHLEFLDQTRAFYHLEGQIYAHAAVSSRPPELNEPRWLMWGNWGEIKEHPSGDRIIVGHSAQRSGLPLDKGFAVCIDTYCYGGGWLTALDVWEEHVFQSNEAGQTRRFQLGNLP